MESELLRDLVVIFAVAVVIVAALRRIGVPAIAGFILVGMLVGPSALHLVADVEDVEALAEIGVVLLLFGIGLDLSLDRARRLWRLAVAGGAAQTGITIAAVAAILRAAGLPVGVAVFFGCVVAVSSTAVVLSGLRARGEIDAPHGRFTLGILIFQDLCVVPMMLVIPYLGGGGASISGVLIAVLKAAAVLAAVLLGARIIVPRFLGAIARTRQRELFVLAVFLVCLGTAWVVSSAGVSLALGAFLAGLVVAGSGYRNQALSDVIPFREVFASLFFVSVGMLLDPSVLAANALAIVGILVAIVVGKAFIVLVTGAALRLPRRVCVLAAAALAQASEFSFVLLAAGRDVLPLPEPFTSNLKAAAILSMLVTPLLIALGPHLAAGVGRASALTRRLEVRTPGERPAGAPSLHGHVIIAGYGLTGEGLAQSLENYGVPYVIVDINPENVRRAIQLAEPAYFGDVTSAEVLEGLGARQARELVIVINDIDASVRATEAARRVAPALSIFVRTQYAADMERLTRAGANEVVSAELEASVEVIEHILAHHQIKSV